MGKLFSKPAVLTESFYQVDDEPAYDPTPTFANLMEQLPNEVIQKIAQYDGAYIETIKGLSGKLHTRLDRVYIDEEVGKRALRFDHFNVLIWAERQGYEIDLDQVMLRAVELGSVDMLNWIYANNYILSKRGKRFELVRNMLLVYVSCRVDVGDVSVMAWIMDRNYQGIPDMLALIAAASGNINMLEILWKRGHIFDNEVWVCASDHKRLEVLEWAMHSGHAQLIRLGANHAHDSDLYDWIVEHVINETLSSALARTFTERYNLEGNWGKWLERMMDEFRQYDLVFNAIQ